MRVRLETLTARHRDRLTTPQTRMVKPFEM
jgi:hypothetical protein